MSKATRVNPGAVLRGESPFVLVATLRPVAGLDRFQPAGFPEVGHVIYKAPRTSGEQVWEESVCIVDSAASMANHLEAVCLRGPHDYELVDDLAGMPYLRCVTGASENGRLDLDKREVVVTSLTEGHRIASTYFLEGQVIDERGALCTKPHGQAQGKKKGQANQASALEFQEVLIEKFGIELPGSKKAHPPAEKWWNVFQTIFRYDPNALVHGVLFPQWQIKIPRVLTAHLEAFGAGRVDRSGVKFDRLGMTTSGQPIFAVDDATAREIRATFILDTALVRSFGRGNGDGWLGLRENQQEFLVALALWKIKRLLEKPFRFRSGCHLECVGLKSNGEEAEIDVNIREAIEKAGFEEPRVTDLYWPREALYRVGAEEPAEAGSAGEEEEDAAE
ncbi:MAG: type I-U CRISPR-associated protein Cas7 [Candidatus Binatia bacterium]|nr:type I-U CRISPR-associated protein Cas7 [Candidatus Binatia bacterium]